MPQVITIDFETFYSREFSLTKLATEQYVRSPLFETIGAAIGVGDEPPVWYPKPEVVDALAAIDWSNKLVLAQNTAFDASILAWHYGVNPLAWLDTLGMSRALFPHAKSHSLKAQAERQGVGVKGDEVLNALGKRYADFTPQDLARYGEYCVNDSLLTKRLFDTYRGMGFPKIELRLIDLTLRMFVEPVLILDKPKLQLHLKEVRESKAQLLDDVRDMMLAESDPDFVHAVFSDGTDGIKKLLMSNEKFATLLRSYDVEPPTKISPATKKEAYAFAKTDEEFIALGGHPDIRVQGLVAARLGTKTTIEETRTERFIGMADRGAFPVPLRYYGAHSGRWSGQDSVNMQNLPSRGANAGRIKKSIMAPEGYVVIDCDSAQIEARVLAWLAGQDDLVAAFERREDVYKIMASNIYGVPVDAITGPQRTVGKTVVLGAGYGVGWLKLQLFLKMQAKVVVDDVESKRIVNAYRGKYNRIPLLWRKGEEALTALAQGQSMVLDAQGLLTVVPDKGIRLPNGLFIQYPGLKKVVKEDGKASWMYYSKGVPVYVYGGKVIENCIAVGTDVLTDRGWVAIEKITASDRVHDGVEFVTHGGMIAKSVQPCVTIDGVHMTPDHEVLTDDGWEAASQYPEPYRPDLRHVGGAEPGTQRWKKAVLAFSMSVRDAVRQGRSRRYQGDKTRGLPKLRVRNQEAYLPWQQNARHEQAPSVCSMEVDARPLPTAVPPSMGKLWRAGDYRVRSVAGRIHKFLGRYGADVRSGLGLGSYGQQRPLLAGELPLGFTSRQLDEQAQYRTSGGHNSLESADRDRPHNLILPTSARLASGAVDAEARREKPVYDILNAGPRSRFVVRGDNGPFVVHNCCQAVARIIIGEQMLRIAKRYKVVLTVHDAVAIVAKAEEAAEAQAFVEACMNWRPKWAQTLPLACESGIGKSYGDC